MTGYLFGMSQLMNGIFFLPHFPNLYQRCDGEYATDHPIQHVLVGIDLISDQLATENEK